MKNHTGTGEGQWVDCARGLSARTLLQKLRWCTLGPQFNWTERAYDWHAPYAPLPNELRTLAISLCTSIAGSMPEMVAGEHLQIPQGTARPAYAGWH